MFCTKPLGNAQCPYSARTVPVQCPYSARCEFIQCPYILPKKEGLGYWLFQGKYGHCMNSQRALYGNCTGTVRALYGHCVIPKVFVPFM